MKAGAGARGGQRLCLLEEALERRAMGGPFSGPLIADGATGTVLAAMNGGDYSRLALLPLEKPEYLRSLHRAYLGAGADLIETATFMADAHSLSQLPGCAGSAAELAYRCGKAAASVAVDEARHAEHSLGMRKWVAGSVGPGADTAEAYIPLIRGLVDGGVDFILIETIQNTARMQAALEAAASGRGGRGIAIALSAAVDSAGQLCPGTGLREFAASALLWKPLFIGLNCGLGPQSLQKPLTELARLSDLPLSFMPSAGIPEEASGRPPRWPLDPDAFAEESAAVIKQTEPAIVGGCCGTTPMHILRLAAALKSS